jgi:hypothetical protein
MLIREWLTSKQRTDFRRPVLLHQIVFLPQLLIFSSTEFWENFLGI